MISKNLMVEQLLQEIKIQLYCNHENILKLYGVFDDADHIYLVLEYMEEGTLFQLLKRRKTLPEPEAAVYLRQVAHAITYLHDRGIAHRDIKPENIVMSYGVGKLCDFGWAAICTDRRKTYCGTFDYAAPEILEGSEYDMSVDLWCLGVLAYELLVGKAPFYHISRKETMKKILNVHLSPLRLRRLLSSSRPPSASRRCRSSRT
jgi:serine/threonine protein kinase